MRPTFFLNNDVDKPVRAGGILYFRNNQYLLIKCDGKYEDFGGCSDGVDKTIEDMIAREVMEESNEIFDIDTIKKQLVNAKPNYIALCKYVLYVIELDKDYDPDDFGTIETHDNIQRIVKWVDADKIHDKKLHFRLQLAHSNGYF